MKTLYKQKAHAFGKDTYFLGRDADGADLWLEQATWSCEWYWGCGYVETYTSSDPERAIDILTHTHFDTLFLKNRDGYASFFKLNTPLTESEQWQLLELMKSIYTLKETAALYHVGGAHMTSNPCKELLKNEKLEKHINSELLPALFAEVYKILTPTNDG